MLTFERLDDLIIYLILGNYNFNSIYYISLIQSKTMVFEVIQKQDKILLFFYNSHIKTYIKIYISQTNVFDIIKSKKLLKGEKFYDNWVRQSEHHRSIIRFTIRCAK